MSVYIVQRAWERMSEVESDGTKLVLIALADYANQEGHAWPTTDEIADRLQMGRRTVVRHLTLLRELGLVAPVQRGGRGRGTTYAVVPENGGPTPTRAPDRPEKVRHHDGAESDPESTPAGGAQSTAESTPPAGAESAAESGPAGGAESDAEGEPPAGAESERAAADPESGPPAGAHSEEAEPERRAESAPNPAESAPANARARREHERSGLPEGLPSSSRANSEAAAAFRAREARQPPQPPQSEEEDRGMDERQRLTAISDMEEYADRKAEQIQERDPTHGRSAASRFMAAAEMLIEDATGAWRNPHTGHFVPWPERPALFRTAVLHHLSTPAHNLRSSLIYTLKTELDPYNVDPDSEAAQSRQRESAAGGKPRTRDKPVDDRVRELSEGTGQRMPAKPAMTATQRREAAANAWCADHEQELAEIREEVQEALVAEFGSEAKLQAQRRRSQRFVDGVARGIMLRLVEERMNANGSGGERDAG